MTTLPGIRSVGMALLIGCSITISAFGQTYNIQDMGAMPDGKTLNTQAIQAAINKCVEMGGRVVIPSGTFLSASLQLKSNVHIVINEGGILKGSPSFKDYPDNPVQYQNAFAHGSDGMAHANKAFLFAEGVHNISITGKGTINDSGDSPEFDLGNDDNAASCLRPCMLLIISSQHGVLHDITLTNSAYWLQNYLGCGYLELKGLTIYDQTNYNQDGIDIDAKHVLIADCKIDVDDDGVCLKSHRKDFIVEDVIVRNCDIASNCNAIKFGTASKGGFKNINISNCRIHSASADRIRKWQQHLKFIDQPVTVISGISIESVDGAVIDHISVSGITVQDIQTPILLVLGNRAQKQAGSKDFYKTNSTAVTNDNDAGSISNITIQNVTAVSHSKMSSSITAFPGRYITNIILRNISINAPGEGTAEDALIRLPENSGAYPENRMYGQVFPASGLFVSHVKGLTLDQFQFHVRQDDHRPVVVFDDIENSGINNVTALTPSGKNAAVSIKKCKQITIDHLAITPANKVLVQADAANSKQVNFKSYKPNNDWLVLTDQ